MTNQDQRHSKHKTGGRQIRSRAVAALIALVVIGAAFAVLLSMRAERHRSPQQGDDREALLATAPDALNVILITVDTLRADRIGAYGSDRVATPSMDRFAAEGVLFSNAASTVPFTLPAHSSIMTGTYPPQHGVRENVGYVLGSSLSTLAEEMAASGRSTAGFVSAFVLDSRWGIGRGFDTYFDQFDLEENESPTLVPSREMVPRPSRRPFAGWTAARSNPCFSGCISMTLTTHTNRSSRIGPVPRPTLRSEVAYTDSLIGEFRRHSMNATSWTLRC